VRVPDKGDDTVALEFSRINHIGIFLSNDPIIITASIFFTNFEDRYLRIFSLDVNIPNVPWDFSRSPRFLSLFSSLWYAVLLIEWNHWKLIRLVII